MQKHILLFFFLLVSTTCLQAQSIISGWVQDKADKKMIDGAVVSLLDNEGEMIAYTITKQDGSFILKAKSNLSKLFLHVRLLGYEDYKQEIDNKTQSITVELSFGEIALREVVVKSQAMWNKEDTLVYSVEAFKSVGDKTIGDLIKKLPGMEVSESGAIKYQGEAINKFYIEGLDLLENRYGIATNNVTVDAVQNVEVIERHQPMMVVSDMMPGTNAAINLRLKEGSKNRPTGTVKLGAGYSDEMLWLMEAFALSAGRNKQSIVMYKGNNSGRDVGAELTGHRLSMNDLQDASNFSTKRLLSGRAFSYPPLEKSRFLFNKSHVVSLNNLWKTSRYGQLRVNVQYLHDAQKESIARNSEYLLKDGVLSIKETSNLKLRTNMIDAAITYNVNSPNYFLKNVLTWNGSWDKTNSLVAINEMGVSQHFDLPTQVIKNDLNFVKKWGKRVWDITSFVVYSSQPQLLTVNVDTIATNQSQQVELSGFYTRNSTYYSYGMGNSNFIVKGAVEASIDNYRTDLMHPVFIDSTRSDISSDYVLLELIPTYMYRNGKLIINADVSLMNHYLNVSDREKNASDDKRHFFFANPSLRASYHLSRLLHLRVGYKYTHTIGDFMDLTDVYYMSAYRSFSKRAGVLSENKRQSFNVGVRYRNPLTTFFFNSSFVYSPTVKNKLTTQRFVGNELVSGSKEVSTQSDMLLWTGHMAKYFSAIRTNTSLNVGYNSMKGERQQQGVLYPFLASGWSFMPKVTVKLSDASSLSYQTIASNRRNKITRPTNTFSSSMWQVTQQLSAYYHAGKNWRFNARLEHSYNEVTDDNAVKMFFADVGVTYKHGQMEYNLSGHNLFNERSYSYSSYNGLDRFDYEYELRPRMVMVNVSFKY